MPKPFRKNDRYQNAPNRLTSMERKTINKMASNRSISQASPTRTVVLIGYNY